MFLGVLHFEVWSQIDFMSKATMDTSSVGMLAHLPRYLVVSPAYFFADMFNWELDIVYGWYIFCVTVLTVILWVKTRERLLNPSANLQLVLLVPFLLLFVVNGRFVFGLFGLSLLLYLSISRYKSGLSLTKVVGLFIGLFYCSISSGVFVVGLLFLFVSFLDANHRKSGASKLTEWILMLLIFIPAIALMGVFLSKNLSYFQDEGYGFIGIISHGLGMILSPERIVQNCAEENTGGVVCASASVVMEIGMVFPVLLVLITMTAAVTLIRSLRLPKLAIRGLVVSLMGGVFGITTLMSFIFVLPICVNRKYLLNRTDL